jgi:hypothetical protein
VSAVVPVVSAVVPAVVPACCGASHYLKVILPKKITPGTFYLRNKVRAMAFGFENGVSRDKNRKNCCPW